MPVVVVSWGAWIRVSAVAAAASLGACGGSGGSGDDDGDGSDGDSTATTGPGDDTGGDTGEPADIVPTAGGMRRLLAYQYTATIETLLGPEAAAAAEPPIDGSVGGFDSIAAVELAMAPTAIEDFEGSARAVATAAIQNPSRLAQTVPCVTSGPRDDACYRAVARDFGRLLWRRPLVDAELDAVVDQARAAATWDGGDFDTGVEYALSAMLQSPNFLYIIEVGEPDPQTGYRKLTSFETATRLSFFLAGHTPSAALLDRAEAGTLHSEEQLREVAWGLLTEPGAPQQVRRFYDELLGYRELADQGKDTDLFPVWDEATAASMREETLRLVQHVVFEQDGDVLSLFNADFTFVDSRLAQIYDLPSPGAGWAQVPVPAGQGRAGILTHPAFLAAFSFPTRNSPTRRGLFIQDKLFCQKIPPPPPDVNPTLPDVGPDVTLRERLSAHMEDPACRSCHGIVDPMGFAFENFDAVGAYRTTDAGKPVDATGDVIDLGPFDGAAELATLIRNDPRVPGCLLQNISRHALGVADLTDQGEALDLLAERFAALDSNLRAILVEMAVGPLFLQVDDPK